MKQSGNSEVLEFPNEYFQELIEKARLRMRLRSKRYRKQSGSTSLADRITSKTQRREEQDEVEERSDEDKAGYRIQMAKAMTRQIRRQIAMDNAASSDLLGSLQKAKDQIRKIHDENQRDELCDAGGGVKNNTKGSRELLNTKTLLSESDSVINKKKLKPRKREHKTVTFSSDENSVHNFRSTHSSLTAFPKVDAYTKVDNRNECEGTDQKQDSHSDQNFSLASDDEEELSNIMSDSKQFIEVTHGPSDLAEHSVSPFSQSSDISRVETPVYPNGHDNTDESSIQHTGNPRLIDDSISPISERSSSCEQEIKSVQTSANRSKPSVINKSIKPKISQSTLLKKSNKSSRLTNHHSVITSSRKASKSVIASNSESNNHIDPFQNTVINKTVDVRFVESPIKEYIYSRQSDSNGGKETFDENVNFKSANNKVMVKRQKSSTRSTHMYETYKKQLDLTRNPLSAVKKNTNITDPNVKSGRRIAIRNTFRRSESCDRYLINDVSIQHNKAVMKAERQSVDETPPGRSYSCNITRHQSNNISAFSLYKSRVHQGSNAVLQSSNKRNNIHLSAHADRVCSSEPHAEKCKVTNNRRRSNGEDHISPFVNSSNDNICGWKIPTKRSQNEEYSFSDTTVRPHQKRTVNTRKIIVRKVYTPEVIEKRERNIAAMCFAYRSQATIKRSVSQPLIATASRPSQKLEKTDKQYVGPLLKNQRNQRDLGKYDRLPAINTDCSFNDGEAKSKEHAGPNAPLSDKQEKNQQNHFEKSTQAERREINNIEELWNSPRTSPQFLPFHENSPISSSFSDQNDSAYSSIIGDNNYEGSDNQDSSQNQFLSLQQNRWDTPPQRQPENIGSEEDSDIRSRDHTKHEGHDDFGFPKVPSELITQTVHDPTLTL